MLDSNQRYRFLPIRLLSRKVPSASRSMLHKTFGGQCRTRTYVVHLVRMATKPLIPTAPYILATRNGFEPSISCVTGRRIRPTILPSHIEAHKPTTRNTYGVVTRFGPMCFNMVPVLLARESRSSVFRQHLHITLCRTILKHT